MTKILHSLAILSIASTILIAGCNDSDDSSKITNPITPDIPTVPKSTLEKAITLSDEHMWNRVRPLDLNPDNDSGIALDRACIPTETVIYNGSTLAAGSDPRYSIYSSRRLYYLSQ